MKIPLSRVLLLAAALVAAVTIGAAAFRMWSTPLHLRVAVGPAGGADAKLMTAFNRTLDLTHAGVRLDVVPTADLHDNNRLLGKGDVDLAVVRLDDVLPPSAGVVALLRTSVLIAVAPARLNLDSLTDVKRRRIGLVARSPLDLPGLLKVLDAVGIRPMDVRIDLISADDVLGLTREGHIDVVVIAGAPSDPDVQAVVNSVAGTRKNPPSILSVDVGDVDSATPAGSTETIGSDAFPRLGIPDDDVDTIGVKTALVANAGPTGPFRQRVYDNAIKEITRSLIERHGELAREVPVASLISAPDKDDDSRYPIHAGTQDYLDDTDTSWGTLFSDQIWNIGLLGGMATSVFAAAAAFLTKGAPDPLLDLLGRLRDLTERAEASTDPADAVPLSAELRALTFEMTGLGYQRSTAYEKFAPLQLARESARDAIAALRLGHFAHGAPSSGGERLQV
ncbi:TRAP-type uncharacterized transport system substrate-binding protein [Roseiarcus fermentans]|uniref:TRAP-type uncharacterized transport system substrate-binding protein n=1 Tax=Roseiarcus fermentans TaxID=1473586 RepID=A0A366FSY8_9HYPH|nr:TAXI family TRAP transporter solute-binding subunit [Roseiarcus fermentans]RBP16855.1 TRAP-type uncharacterized transport system substrate-binding protein [Roseiarcus fermentans]